jgi:hypothetical protein
MMARKSKTTSEITPFGTYPPGTYTPPNVNLKRGQTTATATATRQNWPDIGSDVISMTVNISFDGGNTWQLLVGFTARGGDLINPATGMAVTESAVTTSLPQPNNPNRVISSVITTYVTLNSTVAVTVN